MFRHRKCFCPECDITYSFSHPCSYSSWRFTLVWFSSKIQSQEEEGRTRRKRRDGRRCVWHSAIDTALSREERPRPIFSEPITISRPCESHSCTGPKPPASSACSPSNPQEEGRLVTDREGSLGLQNQK